MTPADDDTWRGVFVDVHPVRFTSGPISYRATLRALVRGTGILVTLFHACVGSALAFVTVIGVETPQCRG